MKRNGAPAGQGKLESRFAALTSGLLARKGHAAPSNSPIQDPAEETDAFALEPKSAAGRRQPPPVTAEDQRKEPPPQPAAAPAPSGPVAAPAPRAQAAAPKPPATPRAETAPAKTPPPKAAPSPPAPKAAPITVINERSLEAGYPNNPSPEELAALDAEADEVVSYFQKFGDEETVALEKGSFYGADPASDDDFDDVDLEPLPAPAPGPQVEPVKAGVTVHLSAREFMRLTLGAAELKVSAQDLMAEAIEEYLDARGVISLGGCACLAAASAKSGRSGGGEG